MIDRPAIAVIGTVGAPARYGGFETLADTLVTQAATQDRAHHMTIYCSGPQTSGPYVKTYNTARLRHIPFKANGPQSVLYDALSLIHAVATRHKTLLVLGISGAAALPVIRLISRARIITHIDGIEWRRAKWRGAARRFLRWSERMAIRWSHAVIADNAAIADHIRDTYGVEAVQIAYGGDQAQDIPPGDLSDLDLPSAYALAIARIEPENNVEMILAAFSDRADSPLVMVGNWAVSDEASALRDRYRGHPHLHLLDPIYDQAQLRALRERAALYVHGHCAGGTNPALVEMMHIGRPVAAFDCAFNRETTENRAAYFHDATTLADLAQALQGPQGTAQGAEMARIADRRYRWADITAQYFQLLGLPPKASPGAATRL